MGAAKTDKNVGQKNHFKIYYEKRNKIAWFG